MPHTRRVLVVALLLSSCSPPPDSSEELDQPATARTDGLEDAFSTFRHIFTGNGFDQSFPIGFGYHPGLSTEKLANAAGATPGGSALLQFAAGHLSAHLDNAPKGAAFDLWFVKNVAGTGRTVAPEAGDQMLKVGHFAGTGTTRQLEVNLGANIDFDLDLVVVTRAGQDPTSSRIAVGSRTLFEKRFFRARAGKALDPVTGTVAHDIETTDALVARGAQLFFHETFGGNGRTCGTCHRADDSLSIDPTFIAKLPKTDPLFVAETNPALAQLEDPKLLRTRALIRENVDGFDDPTHEFVERGVPHTLALGLTNGIAFASSGPPDHRLGWGGDGAPGRGTLNEFTFGAVIQHFTKSLARRPGHDFRVPTQEELDALEAFQLFTGRQKPTSFAAMTPTDLHARNGSALFFASPCTVCHVDLSGGTQNENFNTGVANLISDLPVDDGFEHQQTFNVPPLAEAADTAPLFHNNAAPTIEDAVAFYEGPVFAASPFGMFGFNFSVSQQHDIADFLRVVNAYENITQVRKRVAFVESHRTSGNTDLLAIAIADTRDALQDLSAKGLNPAVQNQLRDVLTTLSNAKADSDANRPPAMAHALVFLDSAKAGLFTAGAVLDGGATGGVGGAGGMGVFDGGLAGAGGSAGAGASGGGGMSAAGGMSGSAPDASPDGV